MSVTVKIAGQQAVLADGKWRSANEGLRDLLNAHLEVAQLEIPAHWPPNARELAAARAAAEAFNGQIIDSHPNPAEPSRMPDGRLIVH